MDKAQLRTLIRAERRARTGGQRHADAERLCVQVLGLLPVAPVDVTCYRSLDPEPGTDPLIAALLAAGHRLWLPRIAGRDLTWVHVGDGTKFAIGPMGIAEPIGAAADTLEFADVVVLPGLAADRQGHRLGQGGGFYDRALAGVPRTADGGPLRVLLLHDAEVLDQVPHDDRDAAVDVICTPAGLIPVRG